jgi:hypothetical protein
MTSIRGTSAGRWFTRVMWIGIIANLGLAIPTLLYPAMMLARNSLPPADPLLWPRFSALLLILLSVFYMPAAVDPDRYRVNAWLAVASRLVGVVFFFVFQPAEYRALGMVDLVFFVPEVILLIVAVRRAAAAAPLRSGARV